MTSTLLSEGCICRRSPSQIFGRGNYWLRKTSSRSKVFDMKEQPRPNGRNHHPAAGAKSLISIIMPSRNEGEHLRQTIDSLLANTSYPNFEVLILDDASEDGSGDFLRRPRYANDRRLRRLRYDSPQGLPALWHAGVAQACGAILQFVPAHTCFSPYWLTNLYERLQRYNFRALVGPVISTLEPLGWKSTPVQSFGGTWEQRLQNYRQLRYDEIGGDCQVPGLNFGCMMIDRQVYDEIGGLLTCFASDTMREQDFCLRAYQLGYDCHIEPTALLGRLEKPRAEKNLGARAASAALALDYFTLIFLHLDETEFAALCATHREEFAEVQQAFAKRRPQLETLRRQIVKSQRRSVNELLAPSSSTTANRVNGKDRQEPLVSIVITAVNESSHVQRTVDAILKNTESPAYEIILVDDASSDNSFAFLKEEPYKSNPALRYERFNYSAGMIRARHHGAETARGDYIMIMDAHMSVPPGWLAGLVAAQQRWGPRSAVAPQLGDINPADWSINANMNTYLMVDEKFDFAARDFPYATGLTSVFSGGCFLIARDFYFQIGGIDTGLRHWGCENIDLSMKVYAAGGAVFYEPAVVVGHLWKREVKRNVGYGFDFYYNKLRTGFTHLPYGSFHKLFSNLKAPNEFQFALRQYELNMPELHYQRRNQQLANRRDPNWYVRMFLPQLAHGGKPKARPVAVSSGMSVPSKDGRNGQLQAEEPLVDKEEVAAVEA
jgi:glycosyltransferase involved in cell wall biosynthesis